MPTSSTTKTSPKSSEKEKSLYLRTDGYVKSKKKPRNNTDFETQSSWYVINTSDEERHGEDKRPLAVFSTMPGIFTDDMVGNRLSCVGWESVIYAFTGGSIEAKSEIFYLDTRCPDLVWKKGLAMRVKREAPVCAVLDGGIYVTGDPKIRTRTRNSWLNHNLVEEVDGPWAEVFDPSLNELRFPYNLGSSTTPNNNCPTCHPVQRAIAYGDTSLLVQFQHDDSLYRYDTYDDSWTLIDNSFSRARNIIDNSLVVVEGILYCFDRRVLAYDLAKRRWFSEPVRGFDKKVGVSPKLREINGYGSPDPNHPDAYLVHVGNGKLCLVWLESSNYYDDKSMFVYCTKFRVYKDDDGGDNSTLHAIIDSFGIYTIDANCNTKAELLTI